MSKRKLKVALIFGGTSAEREVSLVSAKNVYENLDRQKYSIEKIEVTKNSSWIGRNLKKIIKSNVAFLALHGPGGEDGTIQGVLESLGIKYTGSGVLASALAMDKAKTKGLVASEGINVAPDLIIHKGERLNVKFPCVVKPNRIGSSLGVSIVHSKKELEQALGSAFKHDDEVMIEPYLSGREFTVPVLGNKELQALPVIEIVPKMAEFFDYQSKYDAAATDEIVPAPISKPLAQALQNIAVQVHQLLGCRGVTRSDFIVTKDGKIYFLEINTIPGMTANSLTPKSAQEAGISYPKFLDKLIQLALEK